MDRQLEALLEQADLRMQMSDWRDAIDLIRRALAIDPDHARAHALLALALLGAKRLAGADIEARLAVTLDGGSAYCHYSAAAVLHARRRLDEAWDHIQVALLADSTDVATHVLGASIRRSRNEVTEARALLQAALELEPSHTGALVELARLELRARNHGEAARYADEALRSKPEDLDAHVIAGLIDLVRGDDSAAERHARFALTQDSTDRDALHLWASIKARRSWTLGLWWRFNAWIALRDESSQVAMLIGSFVLMQVLIILLGAIGLADLQNIVRWGWFGFCAYTWYAPVLFKKLLERDISGVVLDPEY